MGYDATSLQTKKLLADSLKKLMRSKPFSKITVSELVRDCRVNRKTFYYHFEDIYALLKWVLADEAIEVVRHFDLLVDYESAIRYVMEYVELNDYIINCSYDSLGREGLQQFFYADVIRLISSVIEEAEQSLGQTIEPAFKNYVAKFYAEALASMLLDWARNSKHRDREETIGYLILIISAGIEQMFRNIAPKS